MAEDRNKKIRVRAHAVGHYETLRNPGEEFLIELWRYTPVWMTRLDAEEEEPAKEEEPPEADEDDLEEEAPPPAPKPKKGKKFSQ